MLCCKKQKYNLKPQQNKTPTVNLSNFNKKASIRKKDSSKNTETIRFTSNLSKNKSKKAGCLG